MKRLFSVLLAAVLMTTAACGAAPETGGQDVLAAGLSASSNISGASVFSDVPEGAWYKEAVMYCVEHGILSGTSATAFSPSAPMTRAMLAVVLYRMSGAPAVSAAPNFPDIAAGSWCADAAVWASERGIISGYGSGVFGVNDAVTREQMATILWRYTGSPTAGQEAGFADASAISTGAVSAVNWAKANGIISGKGDNRFDPQAAVTRGEAAVILHRYLEDNELAAPSSPEGDLILSVGGKHFTVALEENAASRGLVDKLPLTVTMGELNRNEKYYYLPEDLPTAAERPGEIQVGDLMLYGSNCLVLFYERFSTSYAYTRLGRIADPEGLADAVGSGEVEVTFQMRTGEGTPVIPAFNFETKTVTLNSGYEMPINGLGTYSLHGEECINSVRAALESGVRLIDTASAYGNEEEIGQAIREAIDDGIIKREDVFVTTKIYPGSEMADPETSIQACLDRLNIGYVDLMLLHHPDRNDVKAYKAMERFAADGKIRSIGLSNWYVEELTAFLPQVDTTPALVQNEIHPYYQENDVIPFIQDLGIVVQGWYPLGGRGHTAELLGDPTISAIAQAHGVSSAQVILRWNPQKGVVVIPGSSDPDHIQENTELYHFSLTDEEMARINALDRGEKHDWY